MKKFSMINFQFSRRHEAPGTERCGCAKKPKEYVGKRTAVTRQTQWRFIPTLKPALAPGHQQVTGDRARSPRGVLSFYLEDVNTGMQHEWHGEVALGILQRRFAIHRNTRVYFGDASNREAGTLDHIRYWFTDR